MGGWRRSIVVASCPHLLLECIPLLSYGVNNLMICQSYKRTHLCLFACMLYYSDLHKGIRAMPVNIVLYISFLVQVKALLCAECAQLLQSDSLPVCLDRLIESLKNFI